ncbi:MAG: DUF1887 family protein [Verrucomicrobiae bacterium]|nr:DUF1887 family protein [Verrucomicrobiae bacterium]
MPPTLIQLISEQTMPNLLPVLRLRPQRLVHLVTPRTASRSAFVLEAARQAGLSVTLETVSLSPMPTIAETQGATRDAIQGCLDRKETPVVNFTGGTKLMSIGAYAAALEFEVKAMSLYTDTEDACFVDGGTGDGLAAHLDDDFSFTPLRSVLTVNTIAVANGCERVTGGRDWKPFMPLAEHLFNNESEASDVHEAILGTKGLFPGGREPRSPGDWLRVLDVDFALPTEVARLAADCGLVRTSAAGACRLPDVTRNDLQALDDAHTRNEYVPDFNRRRIAATNPVQQAASFLTGVWWEVIVMNAAERSGQFRDLRWSAQVGQRDGADLEEDILGVDGVQALCISCKRGGEKARLLPHLEELSARAHRLGGNFTRRFLAILRPLKGRLADNLNHRARELRIRILTPDDLSKPDVFVPTNF